MQYEAHKKYPPLCFQIIPNKSGTVSIISDIKNNSCVSITASDIA